MIPFMEQYVGVWAMREEEFQGLHQAFRGLDIHVHMAGPDPQRARSEAANAKLHVDRGVAVISLHGTLMKPQSSMSSGTSTVLARRLVRQAVSTSDVRAIMLHIDSPGGTAVGTQQLADDIAAAAKQKPTVAYIEDLGASAAYWVASQAGRIVANSFAMVGSIGTYGIVHDVSGMAEKEGVKVHVVRAGEFKGMGVPGTVVTDEQLAQYQTVINETNEFFVRGVAAGRGLSLTKTRELADGRTHRAASAQALGLIDRVASLDETFSKLAAGHRS